MYYSFSRKNILIFHYQDQENCPLQFEWPSISDSYPRFADVYFAGCALTVLAGDQMRATHAIMVTSSCALHLISCRNPSLRGGVPVWRASVFSRSIRRLIGLSGKTHYRRAAATDVFRRDGARTQERKNGQISNVCALPLTRSRRTCHGKHRTRWPIKRPNIDCHRGAECGALDGLSQSTVSDSYHGINGATASSTHNHGPSQNFLFFGTFTWLIFGKNWEVWSPPVLRTEKVS